MKYLILFLLAISFNIFAQTPLTAEFKLFSTSVNQEIGKLQVSQRPGQIAASLKTDEIAEYLIVDSKEKKILELIESQDEAEPAKEAYPTKWDGQTLDETLFISFISEIFLGGEVDKSEYRFVQGTKIIAGKECRKIELLEDGIVVGDGWILSGLQIGLNKDFGFMRTSEGTIVEFTLKDDEGYSCKLSSLSYSVDPEYFSFKIPEGYVIEEE